MDMVVIFFPEMFSNVLSMYGHVCHIGHVFPRKDFQGLFSMFGHIGHFVSRKYFPSFYQINQKDMFVILIMLFPEKNPWILAYIVMHGFHIGHMFADTNSKV